MENSEKIKEKKIYINWGMRIVFPQVLKMFRQKMIQESVSKEQYTEQTKDVMLLGIDYAMYLDKNPIPIILAASLYRCGYEKGLTQRKTCGAFSFPIAQKFLERNFQNTSLLSNQQMNQILYAILHHESDKTISTSVNYVAACLWDADRTLKAWNGDCYQQFSTERGKYVAFLNQEEQMQFMAQQTAFLNQSYPLADKCKVATHISPINMGHVSHEKEI